MRKTLLALTALGAGLTASGCGLTPIGQRVVRRAFVHGAHETISRETNPNQTVVYVNQGQGNQSSEKVFMIDENLLDGSERDLQEARAVYRVLMLDRSYIGKDYIKKIQTINLSDCPEGFRKAYQAFVNRMVRSRYSSTETQNMHMEAQKEGVVRR